MVKFTPFFIGLRYILSKKDKRIISFTSLISMGGLTLGVLALIIVLAVFNGAQGEQRERTLITVPHADIFTDGSFPQWRQAIALLNEDPEINNISPYTSLEAMLSKNGIHQVSEVKGIDPQQEMLQGRDHQDETVPGVKGSPAANVSCREGITKRKRFLE